MSVCLCVSGCHNSCDRNNCDIKSHGVICHSLCNVVTELLHTIMHVTSSYIVEEKSTTIKNVILLYVVLTIQHKTLNINDEYADFSPTYRHRLVV